MGNDGDRFVDEDGFADTLGRPVIFIPGWSANGAEYINVMYLLSRHYRVIVLDPRNQGLSQNVDYGNRIARHSMDLKELTEHLKIDSADYCGWSMGASILWSYIDLFSSKPRFPVRQFHSIVRGE
ncbi:alpha/beta hydrolase fold [Azotobacter beijerinckii]|uniref:Alpha/beta hydrolase fold n=1 Tax=Azotobacter beijerinckii TaxID=170623 RepID=A0A1H7AIN7_9GAMM|nr:alpha/beta hydrolase fold [Azotobacter beijerinckii]